jgi:hypothetical protein
VNIECAMGALIKKLVNNNCPKTAKKSSNAKLATKINK